MELVFNKSIDIPSAPKTKSKSHIEVQTLPLQHTDIGTTPIEPETKSTQTEKLAAKPPSAKHIRISGTLLQQILNELAKCAEENHLFAELDAFHQNQTMQLMALRSTTIELLETLPVNGLVCGSGRMLAVLCGERDHNTWCLHTGKILIVDRHQRNWVHSGSCPVVATFADQGQLIVGLASGEIVLIFEGEILWSSSSIHLQTVTVLHWISPKLLFSAALDGRLNVLSVQGNSLESVRHSNVSVSELPKAMKKSNSSSLKVGVVSATSNTANEILVATDTGAILSVDVESLESKALGYEIEGIEQFQVHNDKFFSTNANKEAKILERNGQTTEWLGISTVNSMICRRDGVCILLTDNEIIAIRSNPTRILMREPTNLLAVDFDKLGSVVGVELQKTGIQLHWYQISDYS